jgi:hypothetical protein
MVCLAVEHRCIRRSAGKVRGQRPTSRTPSGGRLCIGHTPALLKRMGITGARWGLPGAQAMLWLRAIRANGDLTTYWAWHITQEHHRNHLSRYQGDLGLAA